MIKSLLKEKKSTKNKKDNMSQDNMNTKVVLLRISSGECKFAL